METPKEYYYTYYSYEEWGMGYFGSRGCKCLPEEDINYFGSFSDKNFKPTQKIILKGDYATREEAYADEIILQEHYKVVENPHFANKCYQTTTKFWYKVSKEEAKKGNQTRKELGLGIYGLTEEQVKQRCKKSLETRKKLGLGIFAFTPEQRQENSKNAGKYGGNLGGKVAGNQKWICLETGYVSNAPGLANYQRKRNIDTSKRVRIS